MVEPGETKVKAEEGEERKYRAKFNKKKHGKNNNSKRVDRDRDVPELLKGVEFSMAKNGPDLYLKALAKLQLYASTTYKNSADVWKSLKMGKVVTFTPPSLDENASPMQKEMWKIHVNNTIKHEELLEANLEVMYKVVMSICDPVLKDQVCNHESYEEIDNKQDTLGLLQIIKKAMYSNGDDNNHMGYNHVVAVMNYYRIQQERFQSLQEYRDQFIAYRKVCEQLGIKIGVSENGGTNMLKRMKITNPTQQQKDDAEKKAIEEHNTILFLLGADKYKYGKLIEDMKNDVILKKDSFPKSVSEVSHLLSKWKNSYGGKYNNGKNESNDGIAFTTMTDEKEKATNKNDKKKEITCFKCKQKGHYSNKCTEESPAVTEKKGTSLLINKEDSSDEEIKDRQYGTGEDDTSVSSEEHEQNNQEK